jgi:hypothetical protein
MTDKYTLEDVVKMLDHEIATFYRQDFVRVVNEAYEEGRKEGKMENSKYSWKLDLVSVIEMHRAIEDLQKENEDLKKQVEYFKGEFNFYFKACSDQDDKIETLKKENELCHLENIALNRKCEDVCESYEKDIKGLKECLRKKNDPYISPEHWSIKDYSWEELADEFLKSNELKKENEDLKKQVAHNDFYLTDKSKDIFAYSRRLEEKIESYEKEHHDWVKLVKENENLKNI